MPSDYVVFCGDLIDRTRDPDTNYAFQDENSDLEIIKTLDRLDKEARNYGGRILMLLGNHEMMNFNQIFDFVSNRGLYENRDLDFKYLNKPENLEHITNIFFSQKRKMINKPLKILFSDIKKISNNFNLDLKKRPQNLSPSTYFDLCKEYEKLN